MKFDPCSPLVVEPVGASAEQAAGVTAGVELWRARGLSGLDAAGATTTLEVHIEPGPSVQRGYYDPVAGIVYINGQLDAEALPIVVAHELGHAFGLPHISDRTSVMNPGNVEVAPDADDQAAIEALWGTCTP